MANEYCKGGCGELLKEPRYKHDEGYCRKCFSKRNDSKIKTPVGYCPKCGEHLRTVWLRYGDGRIVFKLSCDLCQDLYDTNSTNESRRAIAFGIQPEKDDGEGKEIPQR